MASTYVAPLDLVERGLDELAAIGPEFRTTLEKQEFLVGISRLIARAEGERLRVLAVSDDIAEATGDRCTASWLATQTRDAHGTVRRHAVLASALDSRWVQTAGVLAAGEVNLAQARVMVEALESLPDELGGDRLAKAETLLVEQAATLGPRDLAVFGSRLLDYLAPDIADDLEYQRLLAAEERASAATKLTMRRRGDGSTDVHARIPDHAAGRLSAYLNAYTAPRRRHLGSPTESPGTDELARLPIARQRGEAFAALLENIPSDSMPRHGGAATSVMVILELDTLLSGIGVATASTGDRITAGEARRLACQAGIIPVVLGGKSEILDVGRTRRLVTEAIRKALNLRDRGCTEVGCSMPAEFCEAHHVVPWSRGGRTSLADCKLLCSFHHHRAHDPAWLTRHHPGGKTSFTRRQ